MKYIKSVNRPETGRTDYYEIPVSVIETKEQYLNVTENNTLKQIILYKAIDIHTLQPEIVFCIQVNLETPIWMCPTYCAPAEFTLENNT